jgi:RNA polymerase sigma factor (sigma-70 family)
VLAKPSFTSVIELHGPALLRFCVAQVGREHAEDCFQETLLAALRGYEGLRDSERVRSWLFAIAAHKITDHYRERARDPDPRADIATLMDSKLQTNAFTIVDENLWAQVQQLPPKQSRAVSLRYLSDLSYQEIAEVMLTSPAAARRNVFEGLARLRTTIEK